MALSRLSLDNHLTTQHSVINTISTDLSSALSLCFYQTNNVPDLVNIILWLGRLPAYRSAAATVTTTSSELSSALSDVLLPYMRDKHWVYKKFLFNNLSGDCSRYQTFQTILSLAEIWNYLQFLQKGDYRRLCDRVLDTKYLSTPPSAANTESTDTLPDLPDYYFLFEKHLIRSLTQLLHSSLPLIWRSWLYRRVVKMRRTQQTGLCGECDQRAVNVVWTGCGHLHCHYCLGDKCGVCDAPIEQDTLCYP